MKKQKAGMVSVIIPVYNGEKYVSNAVLSALRQDYANLEVIAINDCSTDQTGSILDTLALQDPRLQVIHRRINSNLPAIARNEGLGIARGEFVAFLDHDDTWFPSKISRQVSVMLQDDNVAITYSHLFSVESRNPIAGILRLPRLRNWSTEFHPLHEGGVVPCSSVMVQRKIVEEFGGFSEDKTLRAVEDFHLWYRISRKYDISFIPEIHGTYRICADSVSHQSDVAHQLKILNDDLGCDLSMTNSFSCRNVRKILEFPLVIVKLALIGSIRSLFRLSSKHVTHKTSA